MSNNPKRKPKANKQSDVFMKYLHDNMKPALYEQLYLKAQSGALDVQTAILFSMLAFGKTSDVPPQFQQILVKASFVQAMKTLTQDQIEDVMHGSQQVHQKLYKMCADRINGLVNKFIGSVTQQLIVDGMLIRSIDNGEVRFSVPVRASAKDKKPKKRGKNEQ